jgi:hypothetical protein
MGRTMGPGAVTAATPVRVVGLVVEDACRGHPSSSATTRACN